MSSQSPGPPGRLQPLLRRVALRPPGFSESLLASFKLIGRTCPKRLMVPTATSCLADLATAQNVLP